MNNTLQKYSLDDIKHSDLKHLYDFLKYKSFLFWIPIRGLILFVETFRTIAVVNFIDNNKVEGLYQKKGAKFFLPLFFWTILWIISIVLLVFLYKNSLNFSHHLLNVLLPYIWAFLIYFITFAFLQILIIKLFVRNLKKYLNDFIVSSNKQIIYNAKITNFEAYGSKFLKAKKRFDYWYKASDNFAVFEGEEKRINYEGSKRQKYDAMRESQENWSFTSQFLIFGIGAIFWIFQPLIFLNGNLIYLKTIFNFNEIKKYNKKINFYILFNWLFFTIYFIALGVFVYFLFFSNDTLFLSNNDIGFKFLYILLFLFFGSLLFILKNYFIRKILIKEIQNNSL